MENKTIKRSPAIGNCTKCGLMKMIQDEGTCPRCGHEYPIKGEANDHENSPHNS